MKDCSEIEGTLYKPNLQNNRIHYDLDDTFFENADCKLNIKSKLHYLKNPVNIIYFPHTALQLYNF